MLTPSIVHSFHAAAVGQLLDEGDLPLGGPAVVARTDGDGFEFDGEIWR
jgi:hypothetical protein